MLHYTVMTPAEVALERLCDPVHEVSAHYVIGADGSLWQLVRDEDRAWHAGAGAWDGQGDVNSRSIGIELVNDGQSAFAGPQMKVLSQCLQVLQSKWGIPPAGVIGHSDMTPDRKKDPGRKFFWDRLAAAGLALGPMSLDTSRSLPPGADVATTFAKALAEAGYPEAPLADLLEAFRSRFAPSREGPLSEEDAQDALAFLRLRDIDRAGQTA